MKCDKYEKFGSLYCFEKCDVLINYWKEREIALDETLMSIKKA